MARYIEPQRDQDFETIVTSFDPTTQRTHFQQQQSLFGTGILRNELVRLLSTTKTKRTSHFGRQCQTNHHANLDSCSIHPSKRVLP